MKLPECFLLLNLSHIGDILFTTPAIRALKKSHPDSRITCVVLEGYEDVLRNNPFVDEIISRRRGGLSGLSLAMRLRSGRPNTSILFSFSSVGTSAMGRLSGARRRIGFDRPGVRRFLTDSVPFRSEAHRVDVYLDLARAAGAEFEAPRMEMFLSAAGRTAAADLLRSNGIDLDRPIACLSPGSTVRAKEWFPERYASLADRFAADGSQVVVIGSKAERATVDAVIGGAKSQIIDLSGRTGISVLGAVIERCAVVVANDTGPMHMAVALGTPVVALFGSTDANVFGPYGGVSELIWEKLECFPCGYIKECKRECMEAITVERVFEAAGGLMRAGRVTK